MERLDGIGAGKLRALLLFVRGSGRAVSADDAAAALGVHRTVARSRLERLLRARLVEARFSRLSGRTGPGAGRPTKLYSAAPELEALEFPPRRFAALVSRLVDEMPAEGREQALRHAGEEFGRDLARAAGVRPRAQLQDALERVCAAVRSLGFNAVLDRVEADKAVISTPTCPLRPLVVERPELAHVDRGMWAGLVERGLRGIRAEAVECESHSCLESGESCAVVIRLRAEAPRIFPPSTEGPSRRPTDSPRQASGNPAA